MHRVKKTETELKSGLLKIGNERIFANEIEDRLGSFKLESGALWEREKSRSGHVCCRVEISLDFRHSTVMYDNT